MDNSKGPSNEATVNYYLFFFYQLISLINPLSILVPNEFWLSNSGCALYALLYNRSGGFISCNKYFNIIAVVTNGFFRNAVCLT